MVSHTYQIACFGALFPLAEARIVDVGHREHHKPCLPLGKTLGFNGAFPSISSSRISAVSSSPVSFVFEEMGLDLYPILFLILLVASTPAPPKRMGVLLTDVAYIKDDLGLRTKERRCPYTHSWYCPKYRFCCGGAAIGCCSTGCCMKGVGCSTEGHCVSKSCPSLRALGSVC
jgi:hypothetical protein